jgi:hypothetical protein
MGILPVLIRVAMSKPINFLHESFFVPLAPKFRVNGSQSPPELGDLGGLPNIRAGGLMF